MALPTNGRVIIDTTVGDFDIELWSKEAPKTCRNFIALAMEGYYDGVIFHRVVPGFLVQTGDRTGTGAGGESFYGEPFEDEIHPRLRYSHRGLVGMANNGTKNSNDSQFFITLDRADELHGKHTLFGRCIGDTVYNVLKIGELELDPEGKPLYPPKIRSIRIIDNPFPDIIPRITAAEKRAQQRAKEKAQREREEEQQRRGAKKNTKLLSFGAEEEAEEEVVFKKKSIVRPDLIDPGTAIPGTTIGPEKAKSASSKKVSYAPPVIEPKVREESSEKESKPKKKSEKMEDDITKIRERHAQEQSASGTARKSEIEKMEAEIRKLQRKREGDDSDDEAARKKAKKSLLSEELAKYSQNRGIHKKGKKKDEGDILAALNSFRGKLQDRMFVDDEHADEGGDNGHEKEAGAVDADGAEAEGVEVDDDKGFMTHALNFPKDNTEETDKAERDYEVIDPRQRGAKAREEERERKKQSTKGKSFGGRYRK